MPAINVARTDTFEQQRVKINEIGQQIFNVTAGGSDLSTGNLKLGDGTKDSPSLAFVNNESLGLYRPEQDTVGFVSANKNVFNYNSIELNLFQDLVFTKRSISTDPDSLFIVNTGQNYDPGTYLGVSLLGGSGSSAVADIEVFEFVGSSTIGNGYYSGTFNNILLEGGTGSGTAINFTIDPIIGTITQIGSLYPAGTTNSVPLVGGSGSGAVADITASLLTVSIDNPGSSYIDGTYTSVPLTGGNGSGAVADIEILGGSVIAVTIVDSGIGYGNTDILGIDLSPAPGSGASFNVTQIPGEIVDVIITNSGSGYLQNDVIGADYGTGSGFLFTVTNNPGVLENFDFFVRGSGYSVGDILTLPGTISNVTTTLEAEVANISANLVAATPSITVSSTAGIQQGYIISNVSGPGSVVPGTTVQSIDGPTQLTMDRNPDFDGSAVLTFTPPNPTELTVSDATGIVPGSIVNVTTGPGSIPSGTTVISASGTTVVISNPPDGSGSATLSFDPPYGPGTGWSFTISGVGSIGSIAIDPNNLGIGYLTGDELFVNSTELSSPITYTVSALTCQELKFIGTVNQSSSGLQEGDLIEVQGSGGAGSSILKIYTDGSGNILSLIVPDGNYQPGDVVVELGGGPTFTIDTVETGDRFFIDTGSGSAIHPDLTLYVGNTYVFDISDSSLSSHQFALSEFPDGSNSPSRVENLSTILDTSISTVTLTDTTGILPGMSIEVASGTAVLSASVKVLSVDSSTQVTLNELPVAGGPCILNFVGNEFLVNVQKTTTELTVKITEETPSTLYYYCQVHENMAGSDGFESVVTIDSNNPRVFGSDFSVRVDKISESDIIVNDISEGKITTEDLESNSFLSQTADINSLTSNSAEITSLTTGLINAQSGSLDIISTNEISFSVSNSININNNIEIKSNGDIVTTGKLNTSDSLVVNDILTINDNNISTSQLRDIVLTPATTRVAKVDAITAFVIPVGTTNDRPQAGVVEDGSIRFNSQTNQYEGYTSTSNSWSSLGGIRDLDGNTYILAEESVGSNDNTFWFYNDDINTLRLSPSFLDFVSVKKIKSSNNTAPNFVEWTSNTPVTTGQYISYRNNLYEVVSDGTTDTTGNEPTHTAGSVVNGTATLTWYGLAVSPITFDLCEEVRIGPSKDVPLVISSELRFLNNTISTDVEDLVLRPNSGRKVVIDAATTLAVPSGSDADRGVPIRGSLRFSTTSQQFEGYDGTNWGSLGGVKDVNQNTYIIPELSPGSDENILYFVNDNNNTLQLTTTSLDFYTIDTIRSLNSDEFEITASLLTFDNGASAFDNTSTERTFLHTSKQYFDLGLSAGLTTDPVLRLDDQGDVYLNIGFGTGVFDGVKVFDGDLKEFELADVRILTEKITLVKGTSDNGSSNLYESATNSGCKTTVIATNPTSGDKEFIEFGVINDASDVIHTEYGNIRTGGELIEASFELTGSNVVRINISLGADVNPTESVNITIVSNIIKK